jgi:thiol:disulfide interchange protein DsbD
MRRLIFLVFFISINVISFCQIQNPVSWSFTAKKIANNIYEVHLTATIGSGWHMYSQTTPEGGPLPTVITFLKNPLLILSGTPIEVGKLEKHHEPLFGVDVKQYSNKLDFVQSVKVKVKGKVKTSVSGSVEFMLCNNKECLPPKSVEFSIAIN